MELAVLIIGLVAAFLAFHDDYDDGLIGRSSFAVMVTMAIIVVLSVSLGYFSYSLPLEVTVMLWAVAVFMLRHAWRFMLYKRTGKFAWDGADRRQKCRIGA